MKFDSVQIQRTVTNYGGPARSFSASEREEFNFDLLADRKVSGGEKAHADFTHIDAEALNAARCGKDTHRGIQKLAGLAAAI